MVSALYAVLSALLLMKFSFDVVRLRMQYRVAYGDGGFSELQSAIRIHGNAVEYIPIAQKPGWCIFAASFCLLVV